MPTHQETKILPYSAEQMYSLVADVAAYPEFLPWCSAARLRSTVLEGSSEILEADLVISFKVFRERFGSRVTLWPADLKIGSGRLADSAFLFLYSGMSNQ